MRNITSFLLGAATALGGVAAYVYMKEDGDVDKAYKVAASGAKTFGSVAADVASTAINNAVPNADVDLKAEYEKFKDVNDGITVEPVNDVAEPVAATVTVSDEEPEPVEAKDEILADIESIIDDE